MQNHATTYYVHVLVLNNETLSSYLETFNI